MYQHPIAPRKTLQQLPLDLLRHILTFLVPTLPSDNGSQWESVRIQMYKEDNRHREQVLHQVQSFDRTCRAFHAVEVNDIHYLLLHCATCVCRKNSYGDGAHDIVSPFNTTTDYKKMREDCRRWMVRKTVRNQRATRRVHENLTLLENKIAGLRHILRDFRNDAKEFLGGIKLLFRWRKDVKLLRLWTYQLRYWTRLTKRKGLRNSTKAMEEG